MDNGQAKYSVVRKIADGGMAEIYLARLEGARGFQKQVVLKRIRSALISDPHFRHMLIDEAHVAMGLNHGNIAQVLELGEADGHYFLAMELVDGWSLDQVIKRSRKADVPLPLELGLYVVVEVCRALSYAHHLTLQGQPMGIVHRDISPQNVLISDQGDVKLTDFGIAKARTNSVQTSRGVVKGKISYMSPEQASGGELDHRSDLYSLGIVLYSMAAGRLPYEGGTPLEVMVRIQAGDFPPPDKVKPKLNGPLTQLILKAMELLRPGDRFQSAEAMLIAAEKVLRTEFPPTGRTELKAFLAALQERDGVPPISRATADGSRDEKKEKEKKKKKKKTDEEETSDPIQVGSSMMLTTPSPIRQSSEKSAPPPLPRRSGEQPRPRRSRRTPVLMVVGAVAVALFLVLMLAPEPSGAPMSSTDPPAATAPAAAAEEARAQESVISEAIADPGASSAPEDAAAGEEAGEDEERLLAEAVSDAGDVVIGEEDGTGDQPAETAGTAGPDPEPAPSKAPPPETAAAAPPKAPAPPPAQRPAPPKEKAVAKAPAKPSPPPAAKAPDTVSVLITSQPTGAVVKLKKRVFGKTPIPLRFRTGIIFELTFVKNGFTPTNKRFLVTTRKDQKVVAHLPPARKRR